MSKFKPIEFIASMSGKICGHSNKYFAFRNGTQYTGTICNPYTGEPTEKQKQIRQKFADTYAAMASLSESEKDAYKEAFRKQKKCKTLRGYIFSQLFHSLDQD